MDFNKKQRFSIRKFKVGVCSVLLGTLLVGVPLATLINDVAAQEVVLHADDSPDVTLNKVVHEEEGYIEWNYLFNARKERDGASGFYWFMLPQGDQVGEAYDWNITTHSSTGEVVSTRTEWRDRDGNAGWEGRLYRDPYPFKGSPDREGPTIWDLGPGKRQEGDAFKAMAHKNGVTSSNRSYVYLIQSLQQPGAPGGDRGYRYWTVSFKTPIVKGIDPNKVTYVYGFDNTRLGSATPGSPYNSTYGGESFSFKDKVQITNPDKTEVADPNNLTEEEKNKIKEEIEKTNPNLPPGTKIEVGNDGSVDIKYPDAPTDTGSTLTPDETIKTQADKNDPTPKVQEVVQGKTPDASKSIGNVADLPENTTFEYETPVNTDEPGDKDAVVLVNYPDGSQDKVPVTVKVIPNQATETEPTVTPIEKKVGDPLTEDELKNAVSGIPDDATKTVKTPVTTDTVGKKTGVVTVTYSDGSSEDVDVPVNVTEKDKDKYDPQPVKQTVKVGADVDPAKSVDKTGLPEGTTYTWKENGKPDTSTSGDKTGTVVVTYPDKSTDEVEVTVTVEKTDAEKYNPKPKKQTVKVGDDVDPAKSVDTKGLPKGTKYEWEPNKKPDTSTSGVDKPGVVVVTYPDGTKDKVNVKVTVEQTEAEKTTPTASTIEKKVGDPLTDDELKNAVSGVPDNATKTVKTPVTTDTAGKKTGVVTVTYSDGSSEDVEVPVNVTERDKDKYDPQPKDNTVDKGTEPNAEDSVTTDGLPSGTTYTWKEDGKPDTSTAGDKPGTVVVTYPDKSTDEVPVTVTVVDPTKDKDKYDPQPKDNTVDKGTEPNAEDSVTTAGLPSGTTYTWKENGKPDTSTAGDKPGTVIVTYPDKSTDEVPVTVTVVETPKQPDAPTDNATGGTPDNGGTTPDNGGTTPDNGGTTPDNGGTTPDNGGTTPDNGGTTPDNGGTTPDNGGTTPDNGGTTPDNGGTTPDNGGTTPDNGGTTPDNGGTTPDNGGTTPDNGGTTPDNGGTTPDNGGTTPDNGGTTPDNGGTTPDNGGTTPDNGGTTPDNGGTTPDNGGTTPDNGGTTPDNGGTTPDNGGTTPDNGGTTPTDPVKEKSATPTVNPVKEGDTVITGTGVPGSTVTVTLPDGSNVEVPVKEDGTWSVPTKEPLKPGQVVTVVQTEKGKEPSEPTTATVTDKDTDGDGIPDSQDPDIDGDGVNNKDEEEAGTDPTKKDSDGNGVNDGDEDTDKDGIPNKDESNPNGTTVTDRDKDGKPDITTPAKTPAPTVDPVKAGDKVLTGKGVPGAEVTVTLPNGETVTTTVDKDGNWTVKVPDGVTLKAGDKVVVGQTDGKKSPSDKTTVTVGDKDTDGDGIPDSQDPDIDGDGVNNKDEEEAGTDPTKKDSDGNGVNDGDEDTDKDGIPNKDESDSNGTTVTDRDKDGKPDITTPAKTPAPTVDPVKAGDKVLTGKGVPGAEVTVTLPNGETVTTTVDKDGNWTVKVPDGVTLEVGDKVVVDQKDGDKPLSDPTKVTVEGEKEVAKTPAPSVNPVKAGDKVLTGKGVPGAEVTVTLPNGETVTTTVDKDGNWTVKVPDGVTLEVGDKVVVDQKDGDKPLSDPTKVTVKGEKEVAKTPAPSVNPVKAGDKVLTGKGVPGAEVTVTLPNGETVTTTVDKDGNWTVKVPDGVTLEVGDKVVVDQKDGDKPLSDPTKVTVEGEKEVAKTPAPTVDPVKAGDKVLTGKGVPGAEVTVTLPNGETVTTTVDKDGNWTVKVPDGVTLEVGDKVVVDQKDGNKPLSDPTKVTVEGEKEVAKTPAPTVDPVKAGDKVLTGTGVPGATIIIALPNGDTVTTTVDKDGNWTVKVPSGMTLKAGQELHLAQKSGDKASSEVVTVVVIDTRGGSVETDDKAPKASASVTKVDGKKADNQKDLPKTGEALANYSLVGLGVLALAALLGKRKKDQD